MWIVRNDVTWNEWYILCYDQSGIMLRPKSLNSDDHVVRRLFSHLLFPSASDRFIPFQCRVSIAQHKG